MPTPTVNLAGLATYAGQREKALILQVLRGLTAAQHLTLMTGIKSTRQLTKLTTASVARPFIGDFQATDSSLKFSDRELVTRRGKGEWLIDLEEFIGTWLEENMQPGAPEQTKAAVPFSAAVFNQLMLQLSTDLDQNTIWNGVRNASGTTAKDIADGFNTILKREITAGKITPVITGALNTDAVAKVEELYKSQDAKYREMEMVTFMSYANYDFYCEDYRERFKVRTLPDNFLQKAIDHSNGKCFVKPVLWIPQDSDRIVVTPKANMIIGTDRESDMNQVKVLPRLWKMEVGTSFNIGCQFRDLEVLQCNDAE